MGESIKLRDETECAKPLPGFAVNASPKLVLAAARSARFHPLSGLSRTRRVIQSGHARSALGMEKCSLARSSAIQRLRALERSTPSGGARCYPENRRSTFNGNEGTLTMEPMAMERIGLFLASLLPVLIAIKVAKGRRTNCNWTLRKAKSQICISILIIVLSQLVAL